MKKRKQGRPKKNHSLIIDLGSEKMNFNKDNKYPIEEIKMDNKIKYYTAKGKKQQYDVLIYSECPHIFTHLMNLLKHKLMELIWEFDKNGLIISYQLPDNQKNDIIDIKVKLYADKFERYQIRKKTIVKLNITHVHNILKSIPKNKIFAIRIKKLHDDIDDEIETYNPYIMQILYIEDDNNEKHRDVYNITTSDITFRKKLKKVNNTMIYPLIIVCDLKRFKTKCSNILTFTNIFNIKYINGKVKFTWEMDRNDNILTFIESDKFKIIKQPMDKKTIISGCYNLSSISKYISKYKEDLSDIVKLYISNEHPLIIEYDIKKQIGVTQIYVDLFNDDI